MTTTNLFYLPISILSVLVGVIILLGIITYYDYRVGLVASAIVMILGGAIKYWS